MFYFLFTFSLSTWWDFNEAEFRSIVQNSIEKPLFALCYSPFCPHCSGLPEGFQRYNQGLGNRSDIYITSIDCYNKGGCHHFGIRGTPHIALVLGTKRRYWPVTPERGPEGWDRWINQHIGPSLRRVYNESEIEKAKLEPKDGGTTFYLEVATEDDPFIAKVKDLSRTFRIYNDTFIYRVITPTENNFKPKIYAYYSQFCYRLYEGSINGIRSFLDQNKFGVFHRYDTGEFKNLAKHGKKAMILFSEEQPSSSQLHSLRCLPKDHCDAQYQFGWAQVKDDANILSFTGVKAVDLPLLYLTGNLAGEPTIFKGKMTRIWDSLLNSNTNKTNSTDHHQIVQGQIQQTSSIKLAGFLLICLFTVFYAFTTPETNKKE